MSDDVVRDRAYLTAGGDFKLTDGVELFRLDVENHGNTAAFIRGYCVLFAKLEDLRREATARDVGPFVRHVDGLSPLGARKNIFTQLEKPADADAVYGAVDYRDVWGGEHRSRFLLRIAGSRDIPGHGITRLDVGDVCEDYSAWM